MKYLKAALLLATTILSGTHAAHVRIVQTSRAGDRLTETAPDASPEQPTGTISINLTQRFQTIAGFGASFTESSAWCLATLPDASRKEVLNKFFNPDSGAGFSLMRTHMNSCDYSLGHYTYIEPDDLEENTFSLHEDQKGFSGDENDEVRGIPLQTPTYDLLPLIQEAQTVPGASFNTLASPWSPPSWMKNGEHAEMVGGHLRKDEDEKGRRIYWDAWARYQVQYLKAYAAQGVPLWGLTPQNEPGHAEHARWDTCYWSSDDQRIFIRDYLGPELEKAGLIDRTNLEAGLKLFAYDHNKADLLAIAGPILADPEAASYIYGTAFHWYAINLGGQTNYRGNDLATLLQKHPGKALLHSESSIDIHPDAPVDQYWDPNNRDWTQGLFTPFSQYAIDIITDLNHGAIGYIDWCMVLSTTGGPNPYNNFNSAAVLVDPVEHRVIYTPLYYLLSHFSKYVRPGAVRIGLTTQLPEKVYATAMQNPDGSVALILFNDNTTPAKITLQIGETSATTRLGADAIQTIQFPSITEIHMRHRPFALGSN
jgi:glucosylceramidase